MQSDILKRAKLLAAAANQVAEEMSQQAQQYSDTVRARHLEESHHRQEVQQAAAEKEKEKKITSKDIGQHKTVRAAAIQGSTLITTYADIRQFAPRGSRIYVDDVEYRLCDKGEWTANRIQLTEDYRGDTNLDAEVKICITENAVKAQTRSPKRVPQPVSSGDILGAVQGLDGAMGALHKPQLQRSQPEKNKAKLVKQPSMIKTSSSAQHKQASYERAAPLTSHYAPTSVISTPTRTYAQSSVTIQDSPEAATHSPISDIPSSALMTLPRSPISLTPDTYNSITPPTDDQRMLQEIRHIEEFCQDELVQKRSDMHKRMAQTGQQKAAERVQERKRMEILHGDDNDMGFEEAGKRSMYTEDELVEQRRQAQLRVLQKKHEDEARLHQRLQAEQLKQEQLKRRMEEKAEQLRQATAQRVADYHALKRLEQLKAREQQVAEAEKRRQRELEFADSEKLKRALKLKEETELRLQQRQAQEEARRLQEAQRVEERLRELARLRGRTVMEDGAHDNCTVNSGARSARSSSSNKRRHKKNSLPKVEGAFNRAHQVIASVKSHDTATVPGNDLKLPDIRVSKSERSHQRTVPAVPPLAMNDDSGVRSTSKQTTVANKQNNLPPRSKQPLPPSDADDDLSIDSLGDNRKDLAVNDTLAVNDNMSCMSALTLDTDLASEQSSKFTNSKLPRPKKKREVWKKLQPIPVKPYVPVPGSTG